MSIDERNVQVDQVSTVESWIRGITGAAVGGFLGWLIFGYMVSQGFYALALPGAAIGLGFGSLSRKPMIAGGIFSALLALVVMVLCEWRHFSDLSLTEFLMNIHKIESSMTYVFFTIGTVIAFWFGRGR